MNASTSNTRNFCDEVEKLIDDFLEGEIAPKDKEIMESHLAGCAQCKKYLDNTSELILRLGTASGKYEYLNSQEKDSIWTKISERTDFTNVPDRLPDPAALSSRNSKNGFVYRFRYAFAALTVFFVVSVIYLSVKNLNLGDISITQQDVFGMPTYWKVTNLDGTPYISNEAMAKLDSIRDGQFIITNDSSRAELYIADIGRVIVEPNTKLMIIKGEDGKNRISVEYGTVDAQMKPVPDPISFVLPSAIAYDQGGSYKLTVDSTGDGLFYVKEGKVEVVSGDRQSVVPAGSLVMTKNGVGVGTPFSANSSSVFKKALYNFDFGSCDLSCVTTIVNEATSFDAVTLVNMLPKVDQDLKDKVYSKAIVIAPPPPKVPRADSLPGFNEADVKIWVDKIQEEVNRNLERSNENIERGMQNLQRSLENLKKLENIPFDTLKWSDDLEKNFKVKVLTPPGAYGYSYKKKGDSAVYYFDHESFDREMDEMNKEIEEAVKNNKNLHDEEMKKLNEVLKTDMQKLNEQLKNDDVQRNKELKRELEKAKKEMEKALKKSDTYYQYKVGDDGKVKVEVNVETPDVPDVPDIPDDK